MKKSLIILLIFSILGPIVNASDYWRLINCDNDDVIGFINEDYVQYDENGDPIFEDTPLTYRLAPEAEDEDVHLVLCPGDGVYCITIRAQKEFMYWIIYYPKVLYKREGAATFEYVR